MTTDLEELKRLCAGASAGPWQHHFDKIFAPSEKGGQFNVADVRGWGYFTGKGQGALGLDDGEGAARQDANAAFIAAARAAVPDLISRLEASESALAAEREKVGRLIEALRPFADAADIVHLAAQKSDDIELSGELLRDALTRARSAIKEATAT